MAVGLGLLLCLPSLALGQNGVEWPSLQGGPAHTGVAPSPGPAPPLRSLWMAQPQTRGNRELSGAVLAGDVAIANGETGLFAFDPTTGREIWSLAHARGPIVTPAVDTSAGQGGVLVFSEGLGARSGVVAIDLTNRSRVWRIALKATVFSAPTIAEGRAYFGARDRFLYAVDLASGTVDWKVRTDGLIDTSPAVADGLVFAAGEDPGNGIARLYAVEAATGKVAWSFARTGGLGVSSVTVDGGRAFVGFNDAAVRAFDARGGTEIWATPVRATFSPLSTPAISDGSVYIADGDGALYRLDATTGDRRWEYQFPASITLAGSPLVSRDMVFLGVSDGTVGAVDVANGHLVWSVRFGAGGAGALVPVGDVLLVPIGSTQGGIVALGPDPEGHLIDQESPTTLHLPIALANFGIAAVLVMAGILGLFRLLSLSARRRLERTRVASGSDDLSEISTDDEDDS